MAGDTPLTAFVTGAAGFIGTELLKVLVAGGRQVFGLTRSAEAAQHVRRVGAIPVMGDLLEPGQWQGAVRRLTGSFMAKTRHYRGDGLRRAGPLPDAQGLPVPAGDGTHISELSC